MFIRWSCHRLHSDVQVADFYKSVFGETARETVMAALAKAVNFEEV